MFFNFPLVGLMQSVRPVCVLILYRSVNTPTVKCGRRGDCNDTMLSRVAVTVAAAAAAAGVE